MKIREDLLINLRSILKKPVESLLLVLGIALGIGATASGISIVARTISSSKELLAETHYKEIVVSARQATTDMDLPAVLRNDKQIYLSANDLVASQSAPDVAYAYIADRMRIRLGNFNGPGPGPDQVSGPGPEVRVQIDGRELIRLEPGPVPEGEDQADRQTSAVANNVFTPAIEELSGWEVSPEFFKAYTLHPAQGSLFTDEDMRQRQHPLILGANIAKTIFTDGQALGRAIQVRRTLYTITGILEVTGTAFDNQSFTPAALADVNSVDSRFAGFRRATLCFTVRDVDKLDEAKAQINSWFGQTYGDGSVFITIPKEEAENTINRNNRFITIILILAISGLLIACVNVSNILYTRAFRKRKTIGILKALGAAKNRIFQLFFLEALGLGLGGAVAGTGIAIVLANIIRTNLGIGGYSIGMLLLGIILSWGTTMLLTDIPAMQAAKIPASEAIRYE
jgi:putative ABC transport system permease protein